MTIAPQTYYRWLTCPIRSTELEEAYLVNQIVDIYRRNKCVYGVRKMWHAARRAGLPLGRDQVGRLMRIAGIQGVRRGAHRTVTTTRDERALRHPDLVKRGWTVPNRPDAVWVADFTYVWTACGFCYVSFITDVYSHRILGWRASASKTTDPSPRRWPRHSRPDAGRVASSRRRDWFTIPMLVRNIPLWRSPRNSPRRGSPGSIGTVGDALDNALMESTIGLYKAVCITPGGRRRNWNRSRGGNARTPEWLRWYNHERIHSSIDYMTPIEREVVVCTPSPNGARS